MNNSKFLWEEADLQFNSPFMKKPVKPKFPLEEYKEQYRPPVKIKFRRRKPEDVPFYS